MSGESEDRDQKTEYASERKLRHLLEEGNVPLSRDAAALGAFAAGAVVLKTLGGALGETVLALVQGSLHSLGKAPEAALWQRAMGLGVGCCAAIAVGSAVPMLIQTKGQVWANLATPDLSRLWKPQALTRLMRREGWVDIGASVAKVVVLFMAARWAFDKAFNDMLQLLDAPGTSLVGQWVELLFPAVLRFLMAVAAVGALDVLVTRYRFRRDTMMTKEEVRREHKEDDGDPMMKSRRRRKARELIKHRVAVDVPRADAVVVNPTHFAVAIRYRAEEGGSPRVLAKGKGQLAETIREIARANGIPIIEDIPLARLLYKRVRVGGFVPKETYKAVATVLAHVYRLKRRAG